MISSIFLQILKITSSVSSIFIKGVSERSADIINIIPSPSRPVTQYDCGKQISELKSYKFNLGCSLSRESVPPTVAFIGDSHMEHYKSAVWDKLGDESLLWINEASCFPFSADFFMSKTDCRKNGSSQTLS